MIVGEANPLVGGVHDRMPVMLMSEDYDRWLGPTTGIDDLKAMLKPYDPALMEAYAVNRAVNSVKNESALSRRRTDPDTDDKARELGWTCRRQAAYFARREDRRRLATCS